MSEGVRGDGEETQEGEDKWRENWSWEQRRTKRKHQADKQAHGRSMWTGVSTYFWTCVLYKGDEEGAKGVREE